MEESFDLSPDVELQPEIIRYHGLDALRALAMAMGIVLHAALPYFFTDGLWPSDDQSGSIKAIFEFIHMWRMPLFFMLSGFLSALVISRRSTVYWADHRFKRVGLPLLIFWLPIALVLPQIFGYGFKGEFPGVDGIKAETLFNPNHLWFLIHLLLFVGIVGIIRLISSATATIFRPSVFKTSWTMFAGFFVRVIYLPVPLAIIIILFFMLIPTGGELISNLAGTSIYFFLGYGLFSNKNLFKKMKSHWIYYVVFALLAFAAYLWLISELGAYDPKNEEDAPLWGLVIVLKATCAILFSYGFIGLSEVKFGTDSHTWRWLSDSAYWVYLVHLPIVTMITFAMFSISIPVEIKFIVSIVLTSVIGVVTYKYLVRGTVIGLLLNGKRP
jgi:surface polysaccharide O-acyltransferase-like enzyme